MKFLQRTLLTIATVYFVSICCGQDPGFKTYTYNQSDTFTKLHFSFDIPAGWVVSNEPDGTGYFLNCKPGNDTGAVKYNDCFGGLIFNVKYLPCNIDSSLLLMGLNPQGNNIYTAFDKKIKIIMAFEITGATTYGIYYFYSNDIFCASNKKKKLEGKFQFIYFTDGQQTICLSTNGRMLDDAIFEKLSRSFKFI